MGGFYGSVQVRGANREAVQTVLEGLARTHKNRFWLGPTLGGWIGVYPNLNGQDPSIARDLARRLRGELFHLTVHDDDVFAYDYYRDGKRVDQYCSGPDSFGVLSERARKALRGRPKTFAHLAIDHERFATLQSRIAEQQTCPAVFASELLTLLASALGIDNVQTSYEYLTQGEVDVDRWDEFVHIPDLGTEHRRHIEVDSALRDQSQRMLSEGPLLAEYGGQRGREVPSPHWCPSPDGAGFFTVWAPPEFTSREPVSLDRIGPPWSGGPVATGLTIDPRVVQIALSPSGRYLAMACPNGDSRAEAWHLGEKRCVARLPRGHAAYRVGFLPDESAMTYVGASIDSGEIGILPLESGEPRFIAFSNTLKLAACHPAGGTLAVLDGRDRLSVLELPSGRVERILFVNGVRPPLDAVPLLGLDYPRDWFGMAAEALDDLLRQRQDEILRRYEQQIRSQPIGRAESLRKKARARIEALGKEARTALAAARSPEWLEDKALSGEIVTQLLFDPLGERLFVATFAGVRVYRWRDVLEASGEMPPPAFAVNLDPWLEETPEGAVSRNSFVGALAYDPDRDWLLFGGQEGRVRSLDLADGRTGIFLEPPGRPEIGHLALSRDRTALGVTCEPDINEEGPTRRAAVIQFWDYPTLCRRP